MKYFYFACLAIMYVASTAFYIMGIPGLAMYMMMAIIAFVQIIKYIS